MGDEDARGGAGERSGDGEGRLTRTVGPTRLFGDSREGIRRRILFTIAIATGFMAVVAATNALLAGVVWWVAPLLLAIAVVVFLFALLIAVEWFESLVSDEQLFWRSGNRKR